MTCKSEDTREYILNVAFELFLSRGYKEVTMSEMEKSTGLTKGAFYHHFKDKAEIFEAAVTEKIGKTRFLPDAEWLRKVSLKDFLKAYVSHIEQVVSYVVNKLHINYADLQFSNIFMDIMTYIPDLKKNILKITTDEISMWETIISNAKKNDEIRPDVEISVLAYTFLGLSHSLHKNFLIGKSTQYALRIIRLQFEQVYLLVKK